MRIHSSSLNFPPTSLKQNAGRNSNGQNNDLSGAKETRNKHVNQPSSPEEIQQKLKNTSLEVDLTNKNIIKPTDSRTLRALSAYTREFNAPLHDQRTQSITGIDIYA
jgi:hypothetical protein